MQIRTPLCLVLLGCGAFSQDSLPELRPLPTLFAQPPKQFRFGKPLLPPSRPANTAKPQVEAAPRVCSIPLTEVTPKAATAKMPNFGPKDNEKYTMGYVNPPAPPCVDESAVKQKPAPETQP